MMADGIDHPVLFVQFDSASLAVSLPGFWWKLALSWPYPEHKDIKYFVIEQIL